MGTNLISLSPTLLNLFLECPRCFWMQVNLSIRRPFVPFPTVVGGIEDKIKKYFDLYRRYQLLPPEVRGRINGVLYQDEDNLSNWRDWRRGISLYDERINARLRGAIDDLLIQDNGFAPLDYKSRGSLPESSTAWYYQNQLDCYAFLLQRNGCKMSGMGYLLYYYPKQIWEGAQIELEFYPVEVAIDTNRAEKVFSESAELLRSAMPSSGRGCRYCAWADKLSAKSLLIRKPTE